MGNLDSILRRIFWAGTQVSERGRLNFTGSAVSSVTDNETTGACDVTLGGSGDLARELYDTPIPSTSVASGSGAVQLYAWPLATLLPTTDRVREVRGVLTVRDSAGSTLDCVGFVGTIYRGTTSTVSREDSPAESSATSVSWDLTLTRATTDLTVTLSLNVEGGTVVLSATRDGTLTRTVAGEVYFGRIRVP